ncbi:ammonium transporter [Nocardia sp. NPDC004068]|uniref:ammonium transporter n=1 Tax=Nocardia sp. NPDC004068 TaxID=3364303 RepID=UPI00368BFF90
MYKEQVSVSAQLPTVLYIIGLIAVMLALAGVFLFDAGLSRAGNVLHTFVQKLIAAFAAAAGMSLIGFAIWDWQFDQAFGVAHPLRSAIGSWWLAGPNINTFPQHLDPATVPGADSFQAFYALFILFAAFFAALLAGSVIERVKTPALALIALVFGALVIPFGGYLVYGSVGPLSNSGTHDFGGAFFYILLGCWALVLVWRAKPRLGVFDGSAAEAPLPHNMAYTVLGLILFLAGICGYALVNGYLVPDAGYFGITLNESGMGIVVTNVMMAFATSSLGGLVVWRIAKNPYFFLVAPVAGWISVSALIDVAEPWQAGLTALFAPLFMFGVYKLMLRLRLDDSKVVPLTLGPGIYSALVTAAFATGVKQGGYFGLEGEYGFQHATINLGHQILGVVVFVAVGLLSALVVVVAIEKTIGLRDRRVDEGHHSQLDRATLGQVAYSMPGDRVTVTD